MLEVDIGSLVELLTQLQKIVAKANTLLGDYLSAKDRPAQQHDT